jgi:tetratricopeptide (TPR) repeat protein
VPENASLPELSPMEAKVAANPASPLFARVASSYLQQGKALEAMELCNQGLKAHPHYAAGHLILGKCYEAVGRSIEALLEYRRALKILPDNPSLQRLMHDIEQREKESFAAFAEERAKQLHARKDTLTVDEYIADESGEKESTVEFLLKRLQATKQASSVAGREGERGGVEKRPEIPAGSIVTPTLAEIYASQGEYDEAVEAYRVLIGQRPDEVERYEKRIAQLEQLKKLQQADQKL